MTYYLHITIFLFLLFFSACTSKDKQKDNAVVSNNGPKAVVDLLDRVCGEDAKEHFYFDLDTLFNGYNSADRSGEAFQISGTEGSIRIKANTISAMTTGLNWYLNHDAKVNISWNNLSQKPSSYPAPTDSAVHQSTIKYRYYLNYCTFSYSMATWDEERWMKEIDWMALHGVTLPLQIVGIDAVWYKVLTDAKEKGGLGWTHDEANRFVAGPMYQAWFLMNNITGFGGPNPEWWYEREAVLGKKITDRMRELGMTPCLPGFVGMSPRRYCAENHLQYFNSGKWMNFETPDILNPNANAQTREKYGELAQLYYDKIKEVYGFMPSAFSMDPFHEQPNPAGATGYRQICDVARDEMNKASNGALWVAQEWEMNAEQQRINALPKENTLLLDLASERESYYSRFNGHEYAFCMLLNYGGRVGMYGGMDMMLSNYSKHTTHSTLRGIGATAEGIGTNSVMFDLLFELPWRTQVPDGKEWLESYCRNRYALSDKNDILNAQSAWEDLRNSVYGSTNTVQKGCFEPIMCIRPTRFFAEGSETVSQWSRTTAPNADAKRLVRSAAEKMLAVNASNDNYLLDLVDVTRQFLAEEAHTLLREMKGLKTAGRGGSDAFNEKRDKFLRLIDDSDHLLSFIPDFTLNQWLSRARKIASDAGHEESADWLEKNARTLITVWGEQHQCDNGHLHDYSNREWSGLLKDYYKKRWTTYFESGMPNAYDWYNKVEYPFASGQSVPFGTYTMQQVENKRDIKGIRTFVMSLFERY